MKNYKILSISRSQFIFTLSFIFGKANEQIIRIAGVVKAINAAIKLIGDYKNDVKIMDESFWQFITMQKHNKSIEIQEVKIACQLVDYFLHQKLNLVGLIKKNESEYEWLKDDTPLNSDGMIIVDSLERKILMSKGVDIYLTTLSAKHLCNKIEFEKAASWLALKKLGSLEQKVKPSSQSKRKSLCFSKITISQQLSPNQSLELVDNLLSFTVSVDDYKAFFETSSNSRLDISNLDQSNESTISLS